VWLADHDLDGDGSSQITLFSGRGILSESAGPVWMIGTGMFKAFTMHGINLMSHLSKSV
jgi:glucan 1,3-beta-glucosidase